MNRSNMRKTIALVALFSGIIVVVYMLMQKNTKDFESTVINQTQEHLLTIAKTQAKHIEDLFADIYAELEILASNPTVQKRIRENLGADEIPERAYRPAKIAFEHMANIVGSLYRID
ncbi:MAG: cache domain-containing protein, partial [Deltaproteobacteria bacterium]|nr:cache domain-containing protein [Deltaproteobacteria bacterium]